MRTRFLLNYLKAPGLVGAITPSSRFLAQALSRHARDAQHIVELGAGTGVITQHLHNAYPLIPLVIVERDERMAKILQSKFSRCRVVTAEVQQRADLFTNIPARSVVVSSLPFRSMRPPVTKKIAQVLAHFLLENPTRKLVQFSYGMQMPFASPHRRLVWQREELVLLNLPPAWVWTMQRS